MLMKHRHATLILLLLVIGVPLLFTLLNKSLRGRQLPIVPTYDSSAATNASPPTAFPASGIALTPTVPITQTCKNILYPVAVGQQWLYQTNVLSRTDILNMSVLSVDGSQGNVLVKNLSTGTTKRVEIHCDGDVIRSFPLVSLNVLLGNIVNSSMTTSYISGVLAPNEASFQNNNWALKWSSQYLVSGKTTLNYNGSQLNVTMDNSPITLTCQTLTTGDAAFENVTITAGTFHALKVVCTEQGPITANINGFTDTGEIEGRSNQWFVPNVGLIKMQVEFAEVKIFGVSFSVLIDNNFELMGFTPAP